MINWRETILSQFDNSPRLLALLTAYNAQVDPSVDIAALYEQVFDPRTATGWGLDVWGRIVGIGRVIQLDASGAVFGFDRSALRPFGHGTFYRRAVNSNFRLADEAYRLLIFFKAAVNITDGSLRDLNRLLAWFFESRGPAMVLHVGTMKLRFYFDFTLKPFERALLSRDDVAPKPAGVGWEIYDVPRAKTFGFARSGLKPFGHGTFARRRPYGNTANS